MVNLLLASVVVVVGVAGVVGVVVIVVEVELVGEVVLVVAGAGSGSPAGVGASAHALPRQVHLRCYKRVAGSFEQCRTLPHPHASHLLCPAGRYDDTPPPLPSLTRLIAVPEPCRWPSPPHSNNKKRQRQKHAGSRVPARRLPGAVEQAVHNARARPSWGRRRRRRRRPAVADSPGAVGGVLPGG